MRLYVVGDRQTVMGFRLAGVDGRVATEPGAVRAALSELAAREDAGVILVTERVAAEVRDEVDARLYGFGFPLVLEIPDGAGAAPGRLDIQEVVRRAVGVSL